MDNPQKLQDAFEDAYFAILMDAFSEHEGARLLAENKRLAINPIQLPEGMDGKVIKAIDHAYSNLRWKKIAHIGSRIISRVAMVVLAIVVLFSAICMTSSAFRERVLNVVVKWQEQYTSFSFEEKTGSSEESVPHEPYWLPEGYKLVSSEDEDALLIYENTTGDRITVCIKNSDFFMEADTENAENIKHISVGNYDGLLIAKDKFLQLFWVDTEEKVFVFIVCDHLREDEIFSVAESMYNI